MGAVNCTNLPRNIILEPGTTQHIDLNVPSCNRTPPSPQPCYSLSTFAFDIETSINTTTMMYTFTFIFQYQQGLRISVSAPYPSVNESVGLEKSSIVIDPTTYGNLVIADVGFGEFLVTLNNGNCQTDYSIELFYDTSNPPVPLIRATNPVKFSINTFACDCTISGMEIPSSPDGPTAIPNIQGMIYLTFDQQQICQVNYTATFYDKDQNVVENTYVQYCVDVASVLRGAGYTIAEKVRFLQKEGFMVNFSRLVTYAVLRTILSQFVFKAPFNVKFLRRKYYAKFLEALGASQWQAFSAYFTDPVYEVTNYWKFFKC